MSLLSLQHISRSYGSYTALRDFSAEFEAGKIIGLLGPNGAGKTSLIRIITQIIAADEGVVLYKGSKLTEADRMQFGYMPEERGLYKKMKVGEHLIYLGRLKGMSTGDAQQRSKKYLEKLEAADWWNKKVEDLSKGMQQKVQFIATILHHPDFIILDEPFSGLDPINSQLIEKEIRELQARGATILFSTHRMEQVEDLCERIILINAGVKLLDGSVSELKQQFRESNYEVIMDGNINEATFHEYDISRIKTNTYLFHLRENQSSRDLLKLLNRELPEILSFREILPSINEIFIRCINQDFAR